MNWDYYDYGDNYYKAFMASQQKKLTKYGDTLAQQYYKALWNKRKLPLSPLELEGFSATNRGYFDLEKYKAVALKSEQHIHGKVAPGYHEKSWPVRIGIVKSDEVVVPHYFRAFDIQGDSIYSATSKINANLISGRLFPTKMNYYAGYYNGQFGTVGIDLNNIDGLKSLRLDKYLESKGIEIDSVVSLLKAYNKGVFKEDLTNDAIAQLMFAMFSLPNAIGEQDPNTRNAILLGPDGKNTKFDSIVRIDFENNRIFTSPNTELGAKTGDLVRVYPFGIFGRDEQKELFAENIQKAVKDKIITGQDAALILSMNDVTATATRRTAISDAAISIEQSHRFMDEDEMKSYCVEGEFSCSVIDGIAEAMIKRANNYQTNLSDYFAKAGITSHKFNAPTIEDFSPDR